MDFKLLIICVGIIVMSCRVVSEHNENSNIDNIVNNLDTTTFHVPRHIQKREHSAMPKLVRSVVPNMVTVPRVSLQPNIKLNLKVDRPVITPIIKKPDTKRVIGNSTPQSEIHVSKVANSQPQSLPVNNQNEHMHVLIPKQYKEHSRKPVKFYEDPVEIPVRATDVTQPENDAAMKPTTVKLNCPKSNSQLKNKTEIEPKTINMNNKKSEIKLFKTENAAETPKNITECNDIENRKGNEDTHIVDEIPKTVIAPCDKDNADGKAPPTENKLIKALTKNKGSVSGTEPSKQLGCNDIKNHVTIHSRNYEETVQKVGDTPRLSMTQDYQEQYPEGIRAAFNPYQEWTYENPYSNVNKYTTVDVTPNYYQTVYSPPQYKTANNDYSSNFDDANDLSSVYPDDINKYIIRRTWKNTDITIHTNNRPVCMVKSNEEPLGGSGYYDAGTWFGNLPSNTGVYSSQSCYSNQNTGRRYRYFY